MESHAGVLPAEALADVLRRLAPRSLAVSRCVCKAWRSVIDAGRLLRADLLPRSLGGLFVDFSILGRSEFFREPTAAAGSGDLGFLPKPNLTVDDHSGGLVLLFGAVANPATRQWASLPPQPPPRVGTGSFYADPCLAFDPAASPYYEVFLLPVVASWAKLDDEATAGSDWPPQRCETHVFSSRTGRWAERAFAREGGPAGTVADMQRSWKMEKRYSVFFRGALYVHSPNGFFCRVSLENNTYQVIEPPPSPVTAAATDPDDPPRAYLGSSKNGVCCAMADQFQLWVWNLVDKSSGQMEWVLKHHQNNLQGLLASPESNQRDDHEAGWVFENVNYKANYGGNNDRNGREVPHDEDGNYYEAYANYEPHHEDDCDGEPYGDGNYDDPAYDYYEEFCKHNGYEEPERRGHHSYVSFLGFHPFEEVVFLNSGMSRGLAYDLNSSKLRDLGDMHPLFGGHDEYVRSSFPYTPFWMEDSLPTVH